MRYRKGRRTAIVYCSIKKNARTSIVSVCAVRNVGVRSYIPCFTGNSLILIVVLLCTFSLVLLVVSALKFSHIYNGRVDARQTGGGLSVRYLSILITILRRERGREYSSIHPSLFSITSENGVLLACGRPGRHRHGNRRQINSNGND